MEMETFKALTLWFAAGAEAAAALVIGLATIEAAVRSLVVFVRHSSTQTAIGRPYDVKEEIRLRLGRWLALALEFLVAADILRTSVAPTWNEIGQLAAIVILRTVLNFFCKPRSTRRKLASRSARRASVLLETQVLTVLITLIEFGGALIVVGRVAAALGLLALRRRTVEQARLMVVEGALSGLGFKLAATLLKTLVLQTFQQIAAFAAVLALRTFIKAVLNRDRRRLDARSPR